MTRPARLLTLLVAILLLGALAVAFVQRAADRADRRNHPRPGGPAVAAGPVTLDATANVRRLVFRNMAWGPHRDELSSVPADHPEGQRTASRVKCLRFFAAGGRGICLQAEPGALRTGYRAVVLDDRLRELRSYPAAGIPTRARVSPSGRLMAWTVFVSGDSYAGTDFSTRTSILDTRGWMLRENLEEYTVFKDGKPYKAADVNIWGVTFSNDRQFYATVATRGQTYLAAGDIAASSLTIVHANVECPSLSSDGTRIAFKKRAPGLSANSPWRLYVLNLRTMAETATAEHRNVDDQAVWAPDGTLIYSLPSDQGSDLWAVPADGSGTPRRILEAALAPALMGGRP